MGPLAVLVALALTTPQGGAYRTDFHVAKATLASVGRNSYFILEPGYQLVFDGKEDGAAVHLIIDVLDATKLIDGVQTRVVRERETHDGKVVEISMNYFAFDPATKDIYYFGENVDMYRNGKVVNHGGSWLSGVSGAHFGLAMPGTAKAGERYHQEVARKVAMDRAEHVSLTETITTPAGTFKNCLKVLETTPLEPDSKEFKVYAPGVGLVKDGALALVKYGKAR